MMIWQTLKLKAFVKPFFLDDCFDYARMKERMSGNRCASFLLEFVPDGLVFPHKGGDYLGTLWKI